MKNFMFDSENLPQKYTILVNIKRYLCRNFLIMRNFTLILLIISTQILSAQDTKVPFTFDNGTTRMKVGGYVQNVVASDFGGAINNHDFIVSTLTVPESWDQQSRFAIDATASRINLDVTHKTGSFGDIRFFMESDFKGASNVLRLRHAYLSVLGIIAGQTWSFMYDADATANTIDIQGVNSRTFFRTPLLGYTGKFSEHFSAGISLEFPNARITAAGPVSSVTQTVPDIPVFIQYKSGLGHLKLAGVFRTVNYGLSDQEKIKAKQGLGVQLTGSVKPVSALTVYGQGIYGKGIARYINDLASMNLDLLPERTNPGNADVPVMFGASVGLRAEISKKVYLTSNFSIAQLDKKEGFTRDSDYRNSTYFSATLFWKAWQNLLFATEYLYGERVNMNDDSGNSNRLQAMLRYSF